MLSPHRSFVATWAISLISFWNVASHALIAEETWRPQHRWELEPALGASWVYVPALPPPTLQADRFASPERQIRLSESRKVLRYADRADLVGGDASLPVIIERLKTTQDNRALHVTLAAAAIRLADASHAQTLWQILNQESSTRRLIERALIDWKSPVALASWRARLAQVDVPLIDLLLAIEGVGATGSEADRSALEVILRSDRTTPAVQVVTARAMGQVALTNLEPLADQVLATGLEHSELVAAELLSNHKTDQSREILRRIVASQHAPAQQIAYKAIVRHFGELALELAGPMLEHPDNNLRLQAVQVLQRFDDVDSLRLQAARFADNNLQVRATVRKNLEHKAERAELKPIVDQIIIFQLSGQSVQGTEQAILLTVSLGERKRCPQLVQLLEHSRGEISLLAAWALQELAEDQAVLDDILAHCQRMTERLNRSEDVAHLELLRQAFLFEALGINRYAPAVAMLKKYVPKNGHKMGDIARTSAIWALGKILEGSQDTDLATQLAGRMLDMSISDPEDELVRFAAVIALGWIGAPNTAEQVRNYVAHPPSPQGLARNWSLQQLEEQTDQQSGVP